MKVPASKTQGTFCFFSLNKISLMIIVDNESFCIMIFFKRIKTQNLHVKNLKSNQTLYEEKVARGVFLGYKRAKKLKSKDFLGFGLVKNEYIGFMVDFGGRGLCPANFEKN